MRNVVRAFSFDGEAITNGAARLEPKVPHLLHADATSKCPRQEGADFSRLQASEAQAMQMQITTFKDMYIAELQELVSMEAQVGAALLRMSTVAAHPALAHALAYHHEETSSQRQRLESMLQSHGASTRAHTDQAMQALIQETEKMLEMLKGADLRDAGLIASAQKLKHYEIAAYGTAAALAGQLQMRNDQTVLHESLEEEREMDRALTHLAKSEVNRDALAAWMTAAPPEERGRVP